MADCQGNLPVAAFDSATNIQESNIVNDELSIIPLEKDSVVICERCGKLGVRKKFLKRDSRFCSIRCYLSSVRRKANSWRFKLMGTTDHMAGMIPLEPLPQLQSPWPATLQDLQAGPLKHSASLVANSYEWKDELFGCDFLAAPVSLFKHAPLYDMWDNTFEGMKVEVKNSDSDQLSGCLSDYFWVATVIKVKGYMGLLRYEGFGSDDTKDFWVNLCCSEVHPVGWCATRGKPLIPPHTIEDKYSDWKKFLVKQLTGARTLPANFYSKLSDSLTSRFRIGNIMEVVDKNRISQVKLASVHEIVGKRLHVKYYDSSPENTGFWCHEDSPLIHPVGWAFRVGHPLDATPSYCERVAAGRYSLLDATPDKFFKYPDDEPPLFLEGMKLEAIDPLNLSAACPATVMQVLREGYMMIRIDCYPAEASGTDWFCYHQRSPCIFPVGFSATNNIPLVPPAGWSLSTFSWVEYIRACGAQAAGPDLFVPRSSVAHGFVAGMRIECTDLMDPRLVCVATVSRVVTDLLKVHFDGWGEEYDQWLWAHSTDMYPVGWCRAVGHRLEGPLQPPPRPARPVRRPRPPRPSRRRKRPPAPLQENNGHTLNIEDSQHSDTVDMKSLSPLTTASEASIEVDRTIDNGEQSYHIQMESEQPSISSPELNDHQKADLEQEERMLEEFKKNNEVLNESLNNQNDFICNDSSKNQDQRETETRIDDPVEKIQDPCDKVIPRLVNTNVPLEKLTCVDPENWSEADVARFLTINDCQPYCVNFSQITGAMMLQLSKDEIIELLEMKVGPSLKIFDLIQQLKCKIKQPQSRILGSFK